MNLRIARVRTGVVMTVPTIHLMRRVSGFAISVRTPAICVRTSAIDRQELLVERARDNAAMAGVADRAQFVHADALDVPSIVERADDVTVFLTIAGLSVVGPYLAEVLRPGTIVVSNTFAVPGWRPESVTMVEVDRRWGRTPVYRYRVPEAFAGDAGD